jgi:hypothetical protein
MARRYNRIPIPLILALAVAVGVTVTIVIQITVVHPLPAVVLPIEIPLMALESGTYTYTTSISVTPGSYALYSTLAGMGKIQLQANTTGWYYQLNDWVITVVRRSTGDAVFEVADSYGYRVYVKEINNTHAIVFHDGYGIAIIAKKVQVGNTGWIVYHPVATDYDQTTLDAILNLMNNLGYTLISVFQPKPDYVVYSPSTRTFYVYLDDILIDMNGVSLYRKQTYLTNVTKFIPVPTDSAVVVNGIVQASSSDYVLYPVWVLLYYQTDSNVNSALTITPVR